MRTGGKDERRSVWHHSKRIRKVRINPQQLMVLSPVRGVVERHIDAAAQTVVRHSQNFRHANVLSKTLDMEDVLFEGRPQPTEMFHGGEKKTATAGKILPNNRLLASG